jgi:shikimate kinase
MIPDRIFVVGFIGSPKQEVGQALGERLARPVFDTDQLVEASARMPIRELFRKEGDSGYRQRERRSLVSVATGPPAIVVTGAGTFVDRGNRRTMQQAGISVYLDASLEECLSGALQLGLLRPDDENNERFTTLFEQRVPEYEKAEVIVEPLERDAEAIADEILQRLEERVWTEKFM